MAKMKPLPIGVEDFKRLVERDYYFVDKTLMIKDILDKDSMVSLFTRPRRFGKTLNMSMIQRFFEKTEESNGHLFENLNISRAGQKYMQHQGQYPVISVSLKSMKQESYEDALFQFVKLLSDEFDRHAYLLNSKDISEEDREEFLMIKKRKAPTQSYFTALKLLSKCLNIYYNKNVIILIDEYDVPLESSYFCGFYDKMVGLIRSVFESALKTNPALEFAILTGCLRISKESIFTGLNNLNVYSVTASKMSDCFGFTQAEVEKIAKDFEIEDKLSQMKDWYDGYVFGKTEIYNPWSILKYVNAVMDEDTVACQPYWINTSSNSIIHELVVNSDAKTKEQIASLMEGGSIKARIYEDSVYANLNVNSDSIWSFLLFTGYLKQVDSELQGTKIYSTMVIPNREVQSIYELTIQQWFEETVKKEKNPPLLQAILDEDPQAVQNEINRWLRKCISFYDTKENFYHGFLAGLLVGSEIYQVKSNRENGDGRTDITVCEYQTREVAVVIEAKIAETFRQLDAKCDEGLKQIRDMRYSEELIDDCYKKVIRYGVAFYQKACKVKMDECLIAEE
ncbi:MAG: ATP-binding protein [Ruminococcus flavefaciens]|nr:ATP-binding protein [Ruminococcus flavefaciens]MCM1061665.1 ATP-binding protein [Eubacterium sp.]